MIFARCTLQNVVALGVIVYDELVFKPDSCTLTRDATKIIHLELTFKRGVQLSIFQASD